MTNIFLFKLIILKSYYIYNLCKIYRDISDCNIFTSKEYCLKLLELEKISDIFVTSNLIPKDSITTYNEEFSIFINKINKEGEHPYRIVASFQNGTYATLRFGE